MLAFGVVKKSSILRSIYIFFFCLRTLSQRQFAFEVWLWAV